jgi:hypothetical protein
MSIIKKKSNKKFAAVALWVILEIFIGIFFTFRMAGAGVLQNGGYAGRTKLIKAVEENRDFFSRFSNRRVLFTPTLSDYAKHRIYSIDTWLGEGRIGVVFLDPAGLEEIVVFNRETGEVLYKDVNILKKEVRLSMLKESVALGDILPEKPENAPPLPAPAAKKTGEVKTAEMMTGAEILAHIKQETGWVSRIERRRRESERVAKVAAETNRKSRGKEKPPTVAARRAGDPDAPGSLQGGDYDNTPALRKTGEAKTAETMTGTEILAHIKQETGWVSRIERRRRERERLEMVAAELNRKSKEKETSSTVAARRAGDPMCRTRPAAAAAEAVFP